MKTERQGCRSRANPGSKMLKIPIMFLLLAFNCSAFAEWKKVSEGFNSTTYVDLGTLQIENQIATMWSLIDFKKPPFDGNNLPYRSLKIQVQYDCANKQFRSLDIVSFSGNMASGNKPYTSFEEAQWEPVTDRGTQKPLWQIACERTKARKEK